MRAVLIAILLSALSVSAEDRPYTAWLMVMWVNGVQQPYTPIGAYKDYDLCAKQIPVLALKLKIPAGVKVDCIDKIMEARS